MPKITVNELIEIAQAAEEGAPINWYDMEKSKEHTYFVIASAILEQFGDVELDNTNALILLSSLVQAQVENMVLHIRNNYLENLNK